MKKKQIFIQSTEVYGDEFVVSCGNTKEEILSFAKKNKLNKSFYEIIGEFEFQESKQAGATYYYHKNNQVALVSLPPVEDSWVFLTVLLHEIVHVVQQIEKKKQLENEPEAKAYLTEFLFNKIRRRIQGIDKYK